MTSPEEEYFQEELARRGAQIAKLKDELWDLRDRANDATERTSFLQQSITRLQAEVGIRKAKANELEDKVALEQARADDVSRQLAADASARVAEVARLRQAMVEVDQAYLVMQASAEDVHKLFVQKESEVGAMRAVLEARLHDVERARNELAQDEAMEEARQTRLLAHHRERGAEKVKDAEGSLAVLVSEANTARTELSRLERGLQAEQECTDGLEKALRHTLEQHGLATEEANALERELESLDAQAAESDLADSLAASKLQCQYLSQDLANARRHALMQTQSIQGALEETKRMLSDHLDQTRHHMDQTQHSPNDSSLAVLMSAISEAKSRADSSAAARQSLERERDALQEDVRQTEAAVAAEKEKAGRERATRIEEELNAARRALEASTRRVGLATDDARRAEASVLDAQREAKEREALLRSKLEELWRMLRAYHPGGAASGLSNFSPPPRSGDILGGVESR